MVAVTRHRRSIGERRATSTSTNLAAVVLVVVVLVALALTVGSVGTP